MIRPFAETDLAAVMELWLASNLQAHPFIAPSYWAEHLEEVKSLLPQVEVYVDESGGVVNGFLGLTGKGEIAGLFIAAHARGQGIGTRLMRKAKELYDELSLSVYEKNARAVHFYRREGFQLVEKREDPDTGQVEYRMRWAKSRVDTMKGGAKMGPIVYVGAKKHHAQRDCGGCLQQNGTAVAPCRALRSERRAGGTRGGARLRGGGAGRAGVWAGAFGPPRPAVIGWADRTGGHARCPEPGGL